MVEFIIHATEDEQLAVLRAIISLNEIQHLRYMSRSMIASASGVKDSKVRVALQDLIDRGYITQYVVTTNLRRQRYYYTPTASGIAACTEIKE